MRFSAIIPAVLSLAAFILTMLCLFAGSKKGFMEDYAIVTLNTSQIGQNLFNHTQSTDTGDLITNWVHTVTNSLASELDQDLGSLARELGVHDFYAGHILDYCEGYYTPTSLPNVTVSKSSIHKNVTFCSNRTAFFNFDPAKILQSEFNDTSLPFNVNLSSINWPEEITDGIQTLRLAQQAAFVLYCIGSAFTFVATAAAIAAVVLTGRMSACVSIIISTVGAMALVLASAITTAVAIQVARVVNTHGGQVGVTSNWGSKFLGLTWSAAVLAVFVVWAWSAYCLLVWRKNKRNAKNKNDLAKGEPKGGDVQWAGFDAGYE